ncbi:hypothetical protein PoB_007667500 [Plakobranchus ocellatus]|uniref:Uncharacterized protein n=1 Tax=Plakobranchus ocellatus TaxID=259542 RepID=A0AAV4E183_9GAST|nr:hypothetical protein PoB_007667500 [Plakobranchus ocellatus]
MQAVLDPYPHSDGLINSFESVSRKRSPVPSENYDANMSPVGRKGSGRQPPFLTMYKFGEVQGPKVLKTFTTQPAQNLPHIGEA